MKRRPVVLGAGLVTLLALAVSLSIASAGTTRATRATISAPPVPHAAAIRAKYGGQSITFIGDSVGGGHARDPVLEGYGHQGQGRASSDRVGRAVRAARARVHLARVLLRRCDDRRDLAGRVRTVPRRPEAEARS